MLYLLIIMLFATLVLAFIVRSSWAFSLPGVLLLTLLLWLLFGS